MKVTWSPIFTANNLITWLTVLVQMSRHLRDGTGLTEERHAAVLADIASDILILSDARSDRPNKQSHCDPNESLNAKKISAKDDEEDIYENITAADEREGSEARGLRDLSEDNALAEDSKNAAWCNICTPVKDRIPPLSPLHSLDEMRIHVCCLWLRMNGRRVAVVVASILRVVVVWRGGRHVVSELRGFVAHFPTKICRRRNIATVVQ
jgi:hypothetical protein